MNASEPEQTTEDVDAEDAPAGGEEEQELYSTTGPTITRRDFIRAGAAAGAAAAGAGTASAATNNTTDSDGDTTDGGIHDPPNSIDGGELDVSYTLGRDLTEAAIMMYTPIGTTLWAADNVSYAVTNMATWAWGQISGDGEDKQHDQLALDVNAHARTIKNNLSAMVKQNWNTFQMLNNNALVAGEVAAVKAIKSGKSESQTAAAAQQKIYDMIAVYEENFYRILESAIVRLVNLFNQQVVAYANDSEWQPTIHYKRHQNDSYHHKPIGTRTIKVELVNGDVIETEALACNDGKLNDKTESGTVYIHPLFATNAGQNGHDLTQKVKNYSNLQDSSSNRRTIDRLSTSWHADDDVDPVALYVEKYDSNNGRVYPFWSAANDSGGINDVVPSGYANGWYDYIGENVLDRAATLTSDMQTYVSDVWDALQSGDIKRVEEIMSPQAWAELMAGDWLETGSTGFPVGVARTGGYSTDLNRTGTYTHIKASDGSETTYTEANLLWDARNPPNLGSLTSETLGSGDWTINVPIGSGSTFHVDAYPGVTFSASHASESVNSIGVALGTGDSQTPVASKSASSVTPTKAEWEDALSRHGVSHKDTVTISVEASTGAGSSTTVTASSVTVLLKTVLQVGNTYKVPAKGAVFIADANGMHEIPKGDKVRLDSVKDADGNSLQKITISDAQLMTLNDSDEIQQRWDRIIEAQKETENTTPDGNGDVGNDGGGGAGLPDLGGSGMWTYVLGGLGLVTALSIIAQAVKEDTGRRPPRR